MPRSKKITVCILLLLAVLLCAVSVYSIIDRVHAPREDTEPEIWYVSGSLWRGFPVAVSEFNASLGEKYGIALKAKSFPDEAALCEAVTHAAETGETPEMVLCDTDLAAVMNELGMLSDMDMLPRRIGSRFFSPRLLAEAKLEEKLLLIPIASSVDVFIVNTKLMPSFSGELTFEQLCTESGENYVNHSSPLFSISDYARFFKNASYQLGESFDGVSPHDTDSKTSKYIYRQLAEAAYNRGYSSASDDPARLVAEGKLPCAIVSSDEVTRYADRMDPDTIEILACPRMVGSEPVNTERVYGLGILASDEDLQKASAVFAGWFCSEAINSAFIKDRGFLSAVGVMPAETENAVYAKLCDLVSGMIADGTVSSPAPNAVFCIKSQSFNKMLTTIMDSLS